jgi:hypothetical protein
MGGSVGILSTRSKKVRKENRPRCKYKKKKGMVRRVEGNRETAQHEAEGREKEGGGESQLTVRSGRKPGEPEKKKEL